MKKKFLVLLLLLAFCVTAFLIGCNSNKSNVQNPAPQSNPGTSNTSNENNTNITGSKSLTADELKTYTGQNGKAAYVAVNGTVYDVTNTRKWRNGKHEDGIVAGVDLTNMMGQSPHGTEVLKEVPVVGTLK